MRWLRFLAPIAGVLLAACEHGVAPAEGGPVTSAATADGGDHGHGHDGLESQVAHEEAGFHAASAAGARDPASPCTCEAARLGNRWCRGCGVGYVAGVAISSAMLFDALDAHGHEIEPDSVTCDACRAALAVDGFCERDRWGFVDGQLYFTRLTWALARGETRDPARISCERCRLNVASGGWCDACGTGMAGNVAFADSADHRAAAEQLDLLRASLQTLERCETCAVVMFTAATCPRCGIAYRDGAWRETKPR